VGVPLLVRDSVSRGFTHSVTRGRSVGGSIEMWTLKTWGAPIDGLVAAVKD